MLRHIYSNAVGVERREGKRRIVVSRVVDAPAARVWSLLTDTTRWPEWGPSVSAVDCATRYIDDGTTGRIRVSGVGVWVPFEIDSCIDTDDEKRWTWTVGRIPATGHRVDPLGEQCRVAFEVPFLAGGYVPVCRRALARIAQLAERE
jgi:hypothetical protein